MLAQEVLNAVAETENATDPDRYCEEGYGELVRLDTPLRLITTFFFATPETIPKL